MPAGEGGVLHVVGFGGVGVGDEAGVASDRAVTNEGTEAFGFGAVGAGAVADGRVLGFDDREEAVCFGVLGNRLV
jgi:hypothetical protein